MTKKKYRIRKLSPLWWATRIGGAAFCVAATYICVCGAAAFGGM